MHSRFTLALILHAALLLIPQTSKAQIVNVQEMFLNDSKEGLILGITGKTEIKKGNIDYEYYSAQAVLRYRKSTHTILGAANIEYAEKSQNSFTNRHFEHLRYRWNFFGDFGFDCFVQHEFNEFRRLNLRFITGAGLYWHILDKKKIDIFFGSTYMYEYNELSTGEFADSGDIWKEHRWNNYITINTAISKTTRFIATAYYQPQFADFKDFNMNLDFDIYFSINKMLSLVINYNYSRQSNPPISVKKTDHILVAGISLRTGPFFK